MTINVVNKQCKQCLLILNSKILIKYAINFANFNNDDETTKKFWKKFWIKLKSTMNLLQKYFYNDFITKKFLILIIYLFIYLFNKFTRSTHN